MENLGAFFGHLHPVWVHLPIGIWILACVLELVGLLSRVPGLSFLPTFTGRQRTLILSLGAFSAVVAAVLGWLLAHGGDYDPSLVGRHQILGIAAAASSIVVLAVHRVRWLYAPALILSLGILIVAADAGATVTHGSAYLTGHLPPAVAKFLGITAPKSGSNATVVTLERAEAFSNVIQPILNDRCTACHGPTKSNGGLRLDSWELMTKGGKHGEVLRAGDLASSELIRRAELPSDLKEHMPPKGKPQLTDEDLTLLEWWVGAGAPREKLIATLDAPPAVEEILRVRLGGGRPEAVPERAATLAAGSRIAASLGIIVRSLAPDGPWLEVNVRPVGRSFGDRQLAQLAPVAQAVEWLDMGGTSVTDSGLAALGPMPRLQRLHLDATGVTDAGLIAVSRFSRLEYLNLRGTGVTDRGLDSLRRLTRLRALYVWQTAVTPAAVQALGDALVDRRKINRWTAEEGELSREIASEKFVGNTGETLRPPPSEEPVAPKPKAQP